MPRDIAPYDVCQICGKAIGGKPSYRDCRDLDHPDDAPNRWVHIDCVYKESQVKPEACSPPVSIDPKSPLVIGADPAVPGGDWSVITIGTNNEPCFSTTGPISQEEQETIDKAVTRYLEAKRWPVHVIKFVQFWVPRESGWDGNPIVHEENDANVRI